MKQIKRKNKIIISIASLLFVLAGTLAFFSDQKFGGLSTGTSKFEIKDRIVKVYDVYNTNLIKEIKDGVVVKNQETPVSTELETAIIHFNINFDVDTRDKLEFDKRVVFYQECIDNDDGGYKINKDRWSVVSSCEPYEPIYTTQGPGVDIGDAGYNVVVRMPDAWLITKEQPVFTIEYQAKQKDGVWETIAKDKVGEK